MQNFSAESDYYAYIINTYGVKAQKTLFGLAMLKTMHNQDEIALGNLMKTLYDLSQTEENFMDWKAAVKMGARIRELVTGFDLDEPALRDHTGGQFGKWLESIKK